MSTKAEAGSTRGRLASRSIQLAILFAALSTAAAALVVGTLYYAASREMTRLQMASLEAQVRMLADLGDRTSAASLAATIPKATSDGTFYVVLGSGGNRLSGPEIIGSLSGEPTGRSRLITYLPNRLDSTTASELPHPQPKQALAVTRDLRGGGSVTVAQDIEATRTFARDILVSFLIGAAVLGVSSVIIGLAIATTLSRRLDRLTAAMQQIMSGELGQRLPLAGYDDEIDRLVAQVNRMLDQIALLMRGLKDVSDGIAHDLKTPLNRIRTRVEAALRDMHNDKGTDSHLRARAALEQTIEDADSLIRTFDALLLVARLEAKAVSQQAESVDLNVLLGDVLELYEPLAEEQGVQLRVTKPNCAPPAIVAHRQLLVQAVVNLVENAIKYASGRDNPVIEMTCRPQNSGVAIIVADNGPGIPEHERAEALKRFGRLDKSRSTSGFGLGLSLVSAVGELHGGGLQLEDNQPGLRAILKLPATVTHRTLGEQP